MAVIARQDTISIDRPDASDIAANFRTELSTAPTGLVGNWRFNEGSGSVATDSAGTPQNATLFGSAAFSPDTHP